MRSLLGLALLLAFTPVRADELPQAADLLAQAKKQAAELPSATAKLSSAAAPTVDVVLFETNDIHGRLEGAASLATVLAGETRPHLYLDAGDWFQGTPVGNLTRGDAVIAVLNKLGLAAAAIGNHDFDYGQDNAARLIGLAHFPVLGANVSGGSAAMAGALKASVIKTVGGVKIGIFGLLTTDMKNLAFPDSIKGLSFEREVDAAARTVKALRSSGAEVVVAVTHIGIEDYAGKNYGIPEGDIYLAQHVPGIDVILGGHTHTPMTAPVVISSGAAQTIITQTQGSLEAVYRLALSLDAKTHRVTAFDGKPVKLDPAQYAPDKSVSQLLAGYDAQVQAQMGGVIGRSAVAMTANTKGESLIGDWITDILRTAGKTDIGMINTFGIRAELPAGQLTFGDLYKVAPFENRLVKVELKGSELKKLVESTLKDDAVLMQYSGVEIPWDPALPAGARLKSLKVGGTLADDNTVYTVTTIDFVAIAGRYLKTVQATITPQPPDLLRDVLVAKVKTSSPVTAALDRRIHTP
jgi:2',3'-cyclic-nucleotide 2'-phosphodiesterase (5'-nucleotidase family)